MNEIEFEAKLRADGYTEIAIENLDPRPAKGEHGHPPFRSAVSFSRARLSSRKTISERFTSLAKSSLWRTDTHTTNRSGQRAPASSLVVSMQNHKSCDSRSNWGSG